jgi:dihydropteroate synthase type 2
MSRPFPDTTPPGPLLPAGDPLVVGIVNITEDSFSDGGRYLDPAAAIAHARRLRAEGADIIELGPAASHPGSTPVTAAEERRRLAPVLEQLAGDGIEVSVDSSKPQTLRYAISAGATYLNDIHGFGDPGLYPILASAQCRLIVMHAVQAAGTATTVITDPVAVWAGIGRFFTRRLAALQAAGISRNRLIIDPGLGYFLGSTPGPSLAALAGIRELRDSFGVPVLASPSRKSFLRTLTGRDISQSGPATLAAEVFAAWQGADYIRTHDVAATRDALTVLRAIAGQAESGGGMAVSRCRGGNGPAGSGGPDDWAPRLLWCGGGRCRGPDRLAA